MRIIHFATFVYYDAYPLLEKTKFTATDLENTPSSWDNGRVGATLPAEFFAAAAPFRTKARHVRPALSDDVGPRGRPHFRTWARVALGRLHRQGEHDAADGNAEMRENNAPGAFLVAPV